MTDVVSEVNDIVETEVEKPEKEDVVAEADTEKNGAAKKEEETENGNEKPEKGKVENGSVKENGVTVEKETDEKPEGEVCGIKRKSEVGLESSEDAAVETTESKKQKVEETAEPEVASNGVC